MSEKICPYCWKINADGIEGRSDDFYSCQYLNDYAHEKYGYYFSDANEVLPEECTYFMCENCIAKNIIKEVSNEKEIENCNQRPRGLLWYIKQLKNKLKEK